MSRASRARANMAPSWSETQGRADSDDSDKTDAFAAIAAIVTAVVVGVIIANADTIVDWARAL